MKTITSQELMLQAWWDEALIYSDHFFDTTATLSDTEGDDMVSLFDELQMIRRSFEGAEYPVFVSTARQYLLNSMAEVTLSFRAFFAGDAGAARVYMHTAQEELRNLQDEVDRLGLNYMNPDPYLH